jgi:MFS family permease
MTVLDVEQSNEDTAKPRRWLGVRHLQFFLLFLSVVVAYGIRTNMSVGIIAMMETDPPDPSIPTYPDWTEKETILSAFFWGYVIPQIGAGQLVKKFGPKWFLAVTMFINSLFTLLIPVMASSAGEGGVIACRVIQGLNQGFLFPSIHMLLGKWTPLPERSQVASFVYTGGPLGTVISLPVTGVIANSSIGWPTAFYLYGGLGIGWSVLWALLGADSPAKHGRISDEEKEYIKGGGNTTDGEQKELPTPWLSIATSMPFIAIFVTHCGQNWGFWTLMTEIPSYMSDIMKYDIKDNSLLSALPYFVLWILSFFFSPLADFLIVRHYLSIGNVRKIFNSIGLMVPAITLVALAFVDSSQKDLALALLVITVGFNAAVYSGFNVNHIDLSPNHAGPLMGITNSLSNVVSILAPLAIKVIPYEQTDPILWRYVFCIAAGIYVVTDLFYVVYASGEVQPWNDETGKKEESSKEEEGKDH